jgi:dephospho-CoA kinase
VPVFWPDGHSQGYWFVGVMFRLGLTGGIGSGKSTVAGMLEQLGAALIDADAISRQSTQANGSAIDAIRSVFGQSLLTPDNALNREAMRNIMAHRPDAKAQLEAIIHPIVNQQMNAQLEQAQYAGRKLAVLDIPLLAEGGSRWRSTLNTVWVVDCLPATQIERVRDRSGWSAEQIQAVMALQSSRSLRLACADAVIYNDGLSMDTLRALVQRMASPLL